MGWLTGQVAFVTGGTGGIGSAIVRRYVQEGAKVGVMARNTEQLETLQKELGQDIVVTSGDVRSYSDTQTAVERTLDAFGRLDTFVANAAIFDYFTRLESIRPDVLETSFQELFSVNVLGYLIGARTVIEPLRETKGSMIFTLSNSSFYAGGGGILYVTAKHALVGLVRQLAFELAPDIRVNGVAPGATLTDMQSLQSLNDRAKPLAQIDGFEDAAAQAVPLRSVARPEDHVGHYVLLASAQNAGQTTAHIIHSDGGWEVRGPNG